MSANIAPKHHLREVCSLRCYRIFDSRGLLGSFGGVVFDPGSWRIERLAIEADGSPGAQFLVPLEEIRTIYDEARRIDIGSAERPPLSRRSVLAESLARSGLGHSDHLVGRQLHGRDARAGRISDLLINIDVWQLRYLVVTTESKTVLTDIEWCVSIGDGEASPRLDLPAAAVAMAPPYRGLGELCSGYEEALFRHYTRRAFVGTDTVT